MSPKLTETFTSNATPGFCPYCGSILPMLRQSGNVTCYTCKHEYDKPDGKLAYKKVSFINSSMI